MTPIAKFEDRAEAALLAKMLTMHINSSIRVRVSQRDESTGMQTVTAEALTSDDSLDIVELNAFCRGFFSHDIRGKYELLV